MSRHLRCSMCPASFGYDGTVTDARNDARASGWRWQRGRDLCPVHAQPSAEQPKETRPKSATVIGAKAAAQLLGVHHTTLYAAARRGEVPCRIIGKRFVFVREVLLEWLAGGGS
jgi:excisionase family DNA binding protein